ncbi:uncharacterized protein LOC106669118 isoform X2 [Cimex lectularius]|uniref:Secreted protein n=1 Tax=Cimex lectularius TaxID=79782 RepID=A0A8I6RZ14_CIMLE|nr:uncharacterized protein LOC106669118 isoform X2 [Cimex lectularius]
MSAIYCLLAILLASNVQGKRWDFYPETVNEQSWVKEKMLLAIDGLKDYAVNVEIAKMVKLTSKARNELNLTPANKCSHKAHQQLEMASNSSIGDFIHCTEMPNILSNSKQLVSDVVGLVELYLHDVREILDGADGCTPMFSEDGLKCFNAYLWKVVDLFEQLAAQTDETVLTVEHLVSVIADEILTCKRSFTTLQSYVQMILYEHNKCANSE